MFSKAWDEYTLMCRGLITDLDGRIVARPFPKFFNLSEHEEHETATGEVFRLPPINWHQDFTALKKYDGSLGILYHAAGRPCLATRGSFTSEQAERGTRTFRTKGYDEHAFVPGLTYLFEILYPENRIVVDYGGLEDCVLLDVIDNETGRGVPANMLPTIAREIGCPVAEAIPATAETLRTCAGRNPANEEGYVVRFDDGTRVKIKYEEYCRLHRLITGVNARHIWEALMLGESLDALIDRVPDEFYRWVRETAAKIQADFDSTLTIAKGTYQRVVDGGTCASRKDFAFAFRESPEYAPILFHLLDGKDPSELIWKKVRPVFSSPFKDDPDA